MFYMKVVRLVILFLTISVSATSAEVVTKWRMQGSSLILEGSTNLADPRQGQSAVIALAFEKSFLSCKPSVAFLSFKGSTLGKAVRQESSKRKKNQLTLFVNQKKFIAQKKTQINTYSNGVEIVAFFDDSLLKELSKPSTIKVSVGGQQPLIAFRAVNSIGPSIDELYRLCH